MATNRWGTETKRIALVVNDYDDRAQQAASMLRAWCAENDVLIHSLQGDLFENASSDFRRASDPVIAAQDNLEDAVNPCHPPCDGPCDLIVAFGGDGTILRAVHEFFPCTVPVLGIKFGRLGFLSGAPAEEMLGAVAAALKGEAQTEQRAMLQVKAWSGDKLLGIYYALNEALLGRHTDARVVATSLSINGHSVYQLRGDGIIVSTATGSTAYSLSAGGPIQSPESRAMTLVPMASHTLTNRVICTARNDVVRIELPDPKHAGVVLHVDGQVVINNVYLERSIPYLEESMTHVEIRISKDHDVNLVKASSRMFFDTLSSEFFRHESA